MWKEDEVEERKGGREQRASPGRTCARCLTCADGLEHEVGEDKRKKDAKEEGVEERGEGRCRGQVSQGVPRITLNNSSALSCVIVQSPEVTDSTYSQEFIITYF